MYSFLCLQIDSVTVYSGLLLRYVIASLVPYHRYTLTVSACTLAGCTTSLGVSARPDEAPPTSLASCLLSITSANAVHVKWGPPDHANGVLLDYELRRDGTLVARLTPPFQDRDSFRLVHLFPFFLRLLYFFLFLSFLFSFFHFFLPSFILSFFFLSFFPSFFHFHSISPSLH